MSVAYKLSYQIYLNSATAARLRELLRVVIDIHPTFVLKAKQYIL